MDHSYVNNPIAAESPMTPKGFLAKRRLVSCIHPREFEEFLQVPLAINEVYLVVVQSFKKAKFMYKQDNIEQALAFAVNAEKHLLMLQELRIQDQVLSLSSGIYYLIFLIRLKAQFKPDVLMIEATQLFEKFGSPPLDDLVIISLYFSFFSLQILNFFFFFLENLDKDHHIYDALEKFSIRV